MDHLEHPLETHRECSLRLLFYVPNLQQIVTRQLMRSDQIASITQLPVPQVERNCTDKVCLLFGPLFFIAIITASILLRKADHIQKLDYSVDSEGKTCGYDLPQYPNLYHPNPKDFNQQICVAKCPNVDDQEIKCKPTAGIACPNMSSVIDTQRVDTERGNYCLPKFESYRYKIIQKLGLVYLKNQKTAIRIAKACIPLALSFGILYLVLVQFFPKCMVWVTIVGAGASLIALGVLVLYDYSHIWQQHKGLKILFGVVSIILGVMMFSVIWTYRGQIALCDIFLRYAGIFLRHYSPKLFLLIPIFTLLTALLMCLCLYMHNSFYNYYLPKLHPSGNYYTSNPSYVLVIINVFTFLWGLNFLRDSFGYILSGNAVEWYFTHTKTHLTFPAIRMVLKNLGSIFGGSYLNTLLFVPSILFDTFSCQQKMFANCHNSFCQSISSFMNISRKDSYAYMNLTGIPICDSARQCQQLCARSPLFPGSHSSLLPFRVAFHLSSLLPVVIITVFYLMRVGSGGHFQLYPVLLVVSLSFCLLTYFIDIHADVGQGLQISYLLQHQLYQLNPTMSVWVGPVQMIREIQGAHGKFSQASNMTII